MAHNGRRRGIRSGALWALIVAAFSCGAPETSRQSDALARTLRDTLAAGSYRRAEELATEWCTRVATERGVDSLELAQTRDWLIEALIRNGKSGLPTTLTVAEQVIRVKEQRLGRDHPDTVRSLHNLGQVHFHRGEFELALPLHERGLTLRAKTVGQLEESLADSLDLVASALVLLQRFEEAAERLGQSQRIREAHGGESPLALAGTLGVVGMMHRYSGRFADAVAPLERALSLRRRHAPEHPDTAATLQTLGDVRFLMGATLDAMQTWSEARRIAEQGLGPDHVVLSELLRRLGLAEFSIGNLAQGRRLREQALRIGERWLSRCDPEVAALVNDLATSAQEDGAYAEARRLYRRAAGTLDDCARTSGADRSPDVRATMILNEAKLAAQVGDVSEAGRLYRAAMDLWSAALGPDHPFVARGLDGLADVAASRGRFDEARALQEDALARRRRTLGPTHPQVAWTLANIAKAESQSGRQDQALQLANDAIAVFRASGVGDQPDQLAQVLELRGVLEARAGSLQQARASVEEALAHRERIFGESHLLVASTRLVLAEMDLAGGSTASALSGALAAEQLGRDHLVFTARYLPERLALMYAARRPRGLDLAISGALTSAIDPTPVLDALVRSRAVVLDELAARSHAAQRPDAPPSPVATHAAQARQRFANLLVRSLEEPVARALLDEARREKEEAERALAELSAEARAELARSSSGFEEVRRAMPAGSVLVSFVQYARSVRPAPGHSPRPPTPSLAAFVTSAEDRHVVLIPLGRVDQIEPWIANWRAEATGRTLLATNDVARANREYRLAGNRLRRAVWDPIASRVRAATRVFVVPDGALGLVSLASLPIGESSYLLEQAPPIHYLSAERDLGATSSGATTGARGMLAFGGPAFDDVSRPVAGPSRPATPPVNPATSDSDLRAVTAAACGAVPNLHFTPLAGTLQEVQEISRLWGGTRGAVSAHVLVGPDASETAFKQNAHSYRVLHLATHGFFLSDACSTPAAAGRRGVGGLSSTGPATAENPLLLSGLALAGANRRASAAADQDDGILTAEEVASLDLAGVEWAVLSACDTGVGVVKAGEGVFGLRRAFQVAGARTVIMSLWSVDDEATRAWMRALYEGRFQRQLSAVDAVHQASLGVLRERRSRELSTHPFYWAAFVAAGDWR